MTDHKRLAAESRVQRLTQERDRAARKVSGCQIERPTRQQERALMAARLELDRAHKELTKALRALRETANAA